MSSTRCTHVYTHHYGMLTRAMKIKNAANSSCLANKKQVSCLHCVIIVSSRLVCACVSMKVTGLVFVWLSLASTMGPREDVYSPPVNKTKLSIEYVMIDDVQPTWIRKQTLIIVWNYLPLTHLCLTSLSTIPFSSASLS